MATGIEIVPYRSSWAAEFEGVAAEVTAALGRTALGVHHIGSTSVPGLDAKDIVDIQVSVVRLDVEGLRPRFEAMGFAWRPDITGDHAPPGTEVVASGLAKLYAQRKEPRPVNCHIRVPGAFNHRYALLFRDYLRADPAATAAYAEIKRQLAARFPADVDAYYAVKDPVCDVIMAAAEEWAMRTSWSEQTA